MAFTGWAIVELFGHQRIAGKVSEEVIGGSSFVRVDVPAIEDQAAFTKLYGGSAIYAITPTDEATAMRAVSSFRVVPVEMWRLVSVEPARIVSGALHDPDNYDRSDDDETF